MKKILITLICMISISAGAQTIEKSKEVDGGKIEITSAESLFGGCQIRMCRYTATSGEKIYGMEVDLTNRTNHVCEGNNLTIHFKDGSRITVSNLWDAQADVKHESYVQSYTQSYTDFVPVYDAWEDAFYSVPVTGHYTEHVPQETVTTFVRLYYILTPVQIQKIINGEVQDVTIVTDESTIVKRARSLSENVAELYEVIK